MKRKLSMLTIGTLALAALLAGCGNSGSATVAKAAAMKIAATTAASSTASDAAGNASDSANAANGSSDDDAIGPKQPYVDPMLTPLTQADIKQYLDVMGAAAARVQHPTAADLAAIRDWKAYNAKATATAAANAPAQASMEAAQKKLQDEMQAAMQSGDMSKLKALSAQMAQQTQTVSQSIQVVTPPDQAISDTAMAFTDGTVDEVIVSERHLDQDHWDRLVSVIEEIDVPPGTGIASCGSPDCAPQLTPEQVQWMHAHDAAVAVNRKILAPYTAQIRAVQVVVRARQHL